ncbi:MAG: N-acetylglucosamine kinase, partial [Alphaproteobacteria bacterium]|nr:N-acetylglucosamine kinase [Alphaproteobacteria bacterium]
MTDEALYVGVDGGGTGCRARLEDAQGRTLGAGIAGPATTRLGIDQSMASIETAIAAALAEAGLDATARARIHAGIGLAGINRTGAREALQARATGFASVVFASDGLIACIGAHGGRDGGIVIVGTGSAGLARVAGREIRVGGYGFPISDEGSGADLGLQAIRLALRAHDGRLESGALLRDVMARFANDPTAAVAWMDKASATDYATFAPLVMRHADQGEPMGRRIVQGAAEQIDGLVRALVGQGAERIALVGGLSSAIEPWLAPDVRRRLKPVEVDAVAGALHLA